MSCCRDAGPSENPPSAAHQQHEKRRSFFVPPDPQLAHAEIRQYRVESIKVVVMRVRQRHHSELLDPPRHRQGETTSSPVSGPDLAPLIASAPAWPPPSISIVRAPGETTKIESPCPTSRTLTSSFPCSSSGAKGLGRDKNGERRQSRERRRLPDANRIRKPPSGVRSFSKLSEASSTSSKSDHRLHVERLWKQIN